MRRKAIVRLCVLVVLQVNQISIIFGWEPLPYDEEQIYEFLSTVSMVIVTLWVWWKNNNITNEAIAADEVREHLKEEKKKGR